MTKMGNSLPSNLHQNFFFKTFVYIVCLHNLLPKITIPSILHMYFLNLRKHITVCRKAHHWGILSLEVVPGCGKVMRGSRGKHINITGSSLMCFSPPPFSRLIFSPLRHSDALKLSSKQYDKSTIQLFRSDKQQQSETI